MKTTGSPQRRASLVRGGVVQNNIPKAHRRSQAAHRAFEQDMKERIEMHNLLTRIMVGGVSLIICAAIVIILVTVATL